MASDDSPEYSSGTPPRGTHVDSDKLRENFKALAHYDQGRVLSMYSVKAAEGLTGSDLDNYKHRLRVNEILFGIDDERFNLSENEFQLTESAFASFTWPSGSDQRLDLLYLDRNGDLGWATGDSPHLDKFPDFPQGSYPLAAIEITADMDPDGNNAAILQSHIHDVRFTYLRSNVEHLISQFDQDSLLRVDSNGDIVQQDQGAGSGLDADTVDNVHAEEIQSGIAQWNSAQNNVDLSNDSPFINTGFDDLRLDGVDSAVFLNGQQLTFSVHYIVDSDADGSLEIVDNDLLPLTNDDVAHVFKLGITENVTLSHAAEHEDGGSDPVRDLKLEILRLVDGDGSGNEWTVTESDTSGSMEIDHPNFGGPIILRDDGRVETDGRTGDPGADDRLVPRGYSNSISPISMDLNDGVNVIQSGSGSGTYSSNNNLVLLRAQVEAASNQTGQIRVKLPSHTRYVEVAVGDGNDAGPTKDTNLFMYPLENGDFDYDLSGDAGTLALSEVGTL